MTTFFEFVIEFDSCNEKEMDLLYKGLICLLKMK